MDFLCCEQALPAMSDFVLTQCGQFYPPNRILVPVGYAPYQFLPYSLYAFTALRLPNPGPFMAGARQAVYAQCTPGLMWTPGPPMPRQ